jgi:hypothetical protein
VLSYLQKFRPRFKTIFLKIPCNFFNFFYYLVISFSLTLFVCFQASTTSATDDLPESSMDGPVLLPTVQAESNAESRTQPLSKQTAAVDYTNLGDTATVGLDPTINKTVSMQGQLIAVDCADAVGRGFIQSELTNGTQYTSTEEPALLISKFCEASDTVRWKFRASGDKNWIFGLVFEDEKLDNTILIRAQADMQSRIFLTGSMDNCQFHDKWVLVAVDFRSGSMMLSCAAVTAERNFEVKGKGMRLALSTGKGTVIMIAKIENSEDPAASEPTEPPSISEKVAFCAVH